MRLQALGHEAEHAADAVREAVRLVQEGQVDRNTLTKTDASPVTTVDLAVQAFLVSRLADRFPDDPIVAEEDAAALRTAGAGPARQRVVELVKRMRSDPALEPGRILDWIDRGRGECAQRFWTIDPIDGTKGLLRGGQYVIALALVGGGLVQVAVVGCPRLMMTTGPASSSGPADVQAEAVMAPLEESAEGGVAVAVRDRGAWWMSLRGNGLMRLSVSTEADPARARTLQSYEPGHGDAARVDRVRDGLGVHKPPILMDSQAKHVLVAAGAAELLLRFPRDPDHHEAIWDAAAGALLIEEAGGRVTDVEGRALDFTTGRRLLRNRGLIASNGRLHERVLEVVRQESFR